MLRLRNGVELLELGCWVTVDLSLAFIPGRRERARVSSRASRGEGGPTTLARSGRPTAESSPGRVDSWSVSSGYCIECLSSCTGLLRPGESRRGRGSVSFCLGFSPDCPSTRLLRLPPERICANAVYVERRARRTDMFMRCREAGSGLWSKGLEACVGRRRPRDSSGLRAEGGPADNPATSPDFLRSVWVPSGRSCSLRGPFVE